MKIGFIVLCMAIFISCSSAPKHPDIITDTQGLAAVQLEAGNDALATLDFTGAQKHLEQAYNLALSVDNAPLIARVLLSQVSMECGLAGEDALSNANALLEKARKQSIRAENANEILALCSVYDVYITNRFGSVELDFEQKLQDAQKELAGDPYNSAFAYRTLGDAYSKKGRYKEAHEAYIKAADIHTKNLFLQEIGRDWYNAASALSLSGDKEGALDDIEKALHYDRNAENTAGIASDYYALSRITLRSPLSKGDSDKAKEYALYAASIFRAGGFDGDAAECESFASNIK